MQLGIVITEANLAETAFNLGIEKSIRSMTEAEKIQLRYITAMRQSINAQNDLERTMYTPANALRILQAQFSQTARAIGNVFIPILIKVLPYVQALVELIGQLAQAMALAFGFELPVIENTVDNVGGSFEDTSDSVDDMTGSMDDATSSAKELKKQLMGFDELNVISPPSSGSSGSGSGGSSGTGLGDLLDLDLSQYGYAKLIDDISGKVKDLKDKIMDFIDSVFPLLALWISTIIGFKLADKIMDLIKKFNLFGGEIVVFGKVLGKGGLAGILAGVIFAFLMAYKTSSSFRDGLKAIGDVIGKSGGLFSILGDLLKALTDFSTPLGYMTTLITGLLTTLAFGNPIFLAVAAVITTVIAAIQLFGIATSDAIKPVDLFGDSISDLSKQKLEPFLKDMKNLDKEINGLTWADNLLTVEDANRISSQAKEIAQGILDELDADRNEDLAKIETLRGVLDDGEIQRVLDDTNKMYDEQITIVNTKTEELQTLLNDKAEGRITSQTEFETRKNEILKTLLNTGVNSYAEYSDEAQSILSTLESNSVQISARQAQQILADAKQSHDDTLTELDKNYLDQMTILKKLHDEATGEDKKFYENAMNTLTTEYQAQVEEVDTQYTNMVEVVKEKLGDQVNAVDFATGEMRSVWGKYWRDATDWVVTGYEWITGKNEDGAYNLTTWMSTKMYDMFIKPHEDLIADITQRWDNFWNHGMGRIFQPSKWKELAQDAINGFRKGLTDGESETKKKVTDMLNRSVLSPFNSMANRLNSSSTITFNPVTGLDGQLSLPGGSSSLFSVPRIDLLAKGGLLDAGQLFIAGERGAELLGKYNQKTTVMPLQDSGFVEAIHEAVYEAISSAFGEMESGDTILQVGEEELARATVKGVNSLTRKTGINPFKM